MRRAMLMLSIFAVSAAAGHFLLLDRLPSIIMARAMTRLEAAGVALHGFTHAPRATPQSQTVVRPSPDLAYSVCRFDVSQGPVLIQGTPWPDYASLSVYAADTDNVATVPLDSRVDGPRAILVALAGTALPDLAGTALPDLAGRHVVVTVSKPRGLALIRRLAPTDARYEEARIPMAGDRCAPIGK